MSAPAMTADGLTKRYGRVVAVDALTMTVPRGAVFGFLGANGAGKTTVVKTFLGLTRPTAGSGTILGEPIGRPSGRRRVGYLPELFRFPGWMTAAEVLRFHCRLAGLPRSGHAREISAALATVGLAGRRDDRVEGFSKGMQQRLGLGAALLGAPELVLLDEPTSALDPVGRQEVRDIITALATRGTTVFLNSHLLGEVERVCDHVAIVSSGRVLASGTVAELRRGEPGVRIRFAGASDEDFVAHAAPFGTARRIDPGTADIDAVTPDRVPDLVAALVAAGVRIHAVEPHSESLEDVFLRLVSASEESGPR